MEVRTEVANTKSNRLGNVARSIAVVFAAVLCVILISLFICHIILLVKGNTNENEVPSLFGISPLYVLTDSMDPEIKGGDLIFVKKVVAQDVSNGDVIAFFDPLSADKDVVAHRVKEVLTDEQGNVFFVTKGDANNTVDIVTVPADNLVGKYMFRVRGMGRVAMFLQSTPGLIVSVSVPLLMLIVFETVRFVRNKKNSRVSNDDLENNSENT